MLKRIRNVSIVGLSFMFLWALPGIAWAGDAGTTSGTSDAPPLPHTELLNSTQFYAALIGALSPGVAYLLNHYGPHVSEKVKTLVFALVAAAAGALAQALDAGTLAFDTNTIQVVFTSVVFAFLAHFGFWKPSTFSAVFKAGTNRPGQPPPV